jgi:hypothetical protein
MNPLGFTMENYDATGAYRTQELTLGAPLADGTPQPGPLKPVDSRSEVTRTLDIDGPVANVIELQQKLAATGEVRECLARNQLSFALARPDVPSEGCSMKQAGIDLAATGGDLRALLGVIARSDAFRHRDLIVKEGCQ